MQIPGVSQAIDRGVADVERADYYGQDGQADAETTVQVGPGLG